MYETDTNILCRVISRHVDENLHPIDVVKPEEIVVGKFTPDDTALLAIGGGYDLGLIETLGARGMSNIRDYVMAGGSYLGICCGAYFASDKIEFDKGGPLEVVGERYLKFYPDAMIGPLFKPYDYKSRKGASVVTVDFSLAAQPKPTAVDSAAGKEHSPRSGTRPKLTEKVNHCHESQHDAEICKTLNNKNYQESNDFMPESRNYQMEMQDYNESQNTCESQSIQGSQNNSNESPSGIINLQTNSGENKCGSVTDYKSDEVELEGVRLHSGKPNKCSGQQDDPASFTCKVYFNGGGYFVEPDPCSDRFGDVTILSRYLDVEGHPPATVLCRFGLGLALLSGAHIEYDGQALDDGDSIAEHFIPVLNQSSKQRETMFCKLLQQLNLVTKCSGCCICSKY